MTGKTSAERPRSRTVARFMEEMDRHELSVSDACGFRAGLCSECGLAAWRACEVWTARYKASPQRHFCVAEKTPDISVVLFCRCERFGFIENPTGECDCFTRGD